MANLINAQIDKIWSYWLIKMSNDPFFKKKKKRSQWWDSKQLDKNDTLVKLDKGTKRSWEKKITDFFNKKNNDFL